MQFLWKGCETVVCRMHNRLSMASVNRLEGLQWKAHRRSLCICHELNTVDKSSAWHSSTSQVIPHSASLEDLARTSIKALPMNLTYLQTDTHTHVFDEHGKMGSACCPTRPDISVRKQVDDARLKPIETGDNRIVSTICCTAHQRSTFHVPHSHGPRRWSNESL